MGREQVYLNQERFNKENHAEKLNKLFSQMVDGYPIIPTPRPTQTHTFDFGCTFMGVQILDRECKASATEADKGFLMLHCLAQLVTQDVALCMSTTSNQFHFYRLKKAEGCIETTHLQTNTYSLWPKIKIKSGYNNHQHFCSRYYTRMKRER